MTSSTPLGMSDFFALEAGEYLDRLDALVQTPAPDAEEVVRLARALRGSALMASQQPIARAAMGLEALARGVREGRRAWDVATKQLATRAVDDLKKFIRKAPTWTAQDTADAEALAAQLEQLGGRPSGAASGQPRTPAAEVTGLDAGARAFVAREGAAIASALDRGGRVLRTNPLAQDPLQVVLKAIQPLRGLAALNDLPPLPDLLEGIEQAIGELGRAAAAADAPPGLGDRIAELFQMAASSIAHAAREVAERGRPDPESAEFRRFAGLLVQFMESEPEVVPIDRIATVVRRGTPPAGAAGAAVPLGQVELVSHGEHLRQAADSLERAPSATQRELRAHTLGGTFRALISAGGGGEVAERVAEFAQSAREAVTRGIAVSQPVQFAAELRRAGEILSAYTGDETATAAAIAAVTLAVRRLGGAVAAPPPRVPAPPPPSAPARTAPPPGPRAAPQPSEASTDLAGTWTVYQRMVGAGIGPASLDELISGTPGRPANGGGTTPAAAPDVVDIGTLLYKGASARQRAQELRELAKRASGDTLRAIIDEVCDLVVLAIEPE